MEAKILEEQFEEQETFINWDDKYLVNVPELDEAHKQLHEIIRSTFESFYKDFKNNKLDMDNFLKFTKEWLENYIMTEDQKYIQE